MALAIDLVLVPVDSSDDSHEAVEYAVAIADRYDADLHLLHLLDERILQGLKTDDIAAETVAEQQRSFTTDVRDQLASDAITLSQSSAVGFSASRLAQTPGSVTLDAAEQLDSDFLVVPRVTTSSETNVLGKAALYILEYASQPVLSV
jgi:nucleotide-binding universal stress UspA family protein